MPVYFPDFDAFSHAAQQGNMVPVFRQLTADTLTPLTAYCRLQPGACSFLFESVVGGERVGRYTFLGADPFLQIDAYGQKVVITRGSTSETAAGQVQTETHQSEDPLRDLENLLAEYKAVPMPGLPRFCGGAVGYAGYDTVRYVEKLPNAPLDDRQLPDLSFAFYDRMLVFDNIRKTILVIAHARTTGRDPQAAYAEACARVDETCLQIQTGTDDLKLADLDLRGQPTLQPKSTFTQPEFEGAVRACLEYIKAGDIFQVVLSQRFEVETEATPLDVYRALRIVNPSPFMFLLRTPHVDLVGSSPEIMVRVEDGEVTIRPLAGTRKRGVTEEEDRRLAEELLADPKERAEHVMLVDLARNDLGRVCQYGSVTISDVMQVERYSHVMHITSNACGQLSPGKSTLDALRSGLPAGTVSGAPKVRAMQIIDELEPRRRGPYGGAVGYVDYTGNMDTCIALRTLVMQGQTAYIQAGAGIVADSDPAKEFEETVNKSKGMLKAIEVAEKQIRRA